MIDHLLRYLQLDPSFQEDMVALDGMILKQLADFYAEAHVFLQLVIKCPPHQLGDETHWIQYMKCEAQKILEGQNESTRSGENRSTKRETH